MSKRCAAMIYTTGTDNMLIFPTRYRSVINRKLSGILPDRQSSFVKIPKTFSCFFYFYRLKRQRQFDLKCKKMYLN